MSKALYREHRPKSLDEVIGQDPITSTLKNALKTGKISHAYLFTGPRGVGKTSVARILAHEINKLPYTDDSEHIDIIEIDAASNRRIDEIRDLRDKARLSPVMAPYKVYIIDEVHMLTREAFNALLKTLEEPPAHVVFILATTEAHKLPETIISRTQRYNFKAIDDNSAVNYLKKLAKKEDIKVDEDALKLIAQHGSGSFRDSISLLDQLRSAEGDISAKSVEASLGIPPKNAVVSLFKQIENADLPATIETLENLQSQGYAAPLVAKALGSVVRTHLIEKSLKLDADNAISLLKELINVTSARDPYQYLELAVMHTILESTPKQPISLTINNPTPVEPAAPEIHAKKLPPPKTEPVAGPRSSSDTEAISSQEIWDNVLDELRGSYNTLYGVARMAKPTFEDDKLILAFAFGFHQRRCNETRNKERLQTIIANQTGKQPIISCVLDANAPKEPVPQNTKAKVQTSDTLESITDVFGGGEILES